MRSASVPSQRHPLLRHVDDQLRALRAWTADPARQSCPLSLAHVRALLCVLDELLLSHALQLSASPVSGSGTLLLDGFLALADAYGSFLAALLALRHHAADLRAALRRRSDDDTAAKTKLEAAARALRRAAKELASLAARCAHTPTHAGAGEDGGELTGTVAEAVGETAAASAAVFLQVASLADAAAAMAMASSSSSSSAISSSSSSSPPKKKRLATLLAHAPARSGGLKKAMEEQQRDAAEKLRELEQCVGELEGESEKVFRSLLQTRVSLLNIHTPTI